MRRFLLVATIVALLPQATFTQTIGPPSSASSQSASSMAGNTTQGETGVPVYGWGGSQQAGFAVTHGASEWAVMSGGLTGNGGVFTCDGAASDVACNIVAKGAGTIYLGDAYGTSLALPSPGGTLTWYWSPAFDLTTPGSFWKATTSGTVNAGIVPGGTGSFMLAVPDGGITGGNERGAQAVDLCLTRTANTQVASGSNSFCVGSGTASGTGSLVEGNVNTADGDYSRALGRNARVKGRYGFEVTGLGFFSSSGDAQIGRGGFLGQSTGGAAVRLTADKGAANTHNCMDIGISSAAGMLVIIEGKDKTVNTNSATWIGLVNINISSTVSTAAVTSTSIATLGTALTVTFSADTTNGCVNATVAPAAGTDTWNFVMQILSAEAG